MWKSLLFHPWMTLLNRRPFGAPIQGPIRCMAPAITPDWLHARIHRYPQHPHGVGVAPWGNPTFTVCHRIKSCVFWMRLLQMIFSGNHVQVSKCSGSFLGGSPIAKCIPNAWFDVMWWARCHWLPLSFDPSRRKTRCHRCVILEMARIRPVFRSSCRLVCQCPTGKTWQDLWLQCRDIRTHFCHGRPLELTSHVAMVKPLQMLLQPGRKTFTVKAYMIELLGHLLMRQ